MSSSLDTASASDTESRTKPRLRGRRRILTVAGVLLALVGGVIAEGGAASAQSPTGYCTQTCNNPPFGVTHAAWNQALEAADFWANHSIDFNQVVRSGWSSYYRLDRGHGGWPDQFWGRNWYGYYEPSQGRDQFVYYGGTYNDYNGLVTGFEHHRGVSGNNAWQSSASSGNAPYVEYDVDYYNTPGSSRNSPARIVRNPRSGNTYVSYDHYSSFYFLGRF